MTSKKPNSEFPHETLSEILKYLPPKPLGQFKTLCKPWLSIIESSFFANNIHLSQMKKERNFVFIFQEGIGKYPIGYEAATKGSKVYKRKILEGNHQFELLASCNGLVLFCNFEDHHFLGNPITTETIVVPNQVIEFPKNCDYIQVFYGAGFDDFNQDYKVVRISYFHIFDNGNEVHIFSTKNASWKRLPPFPYQVISLDPGVYARGHLHWKLYRDSRMYGIARLNCQTETYDFIPIPEDVPTDFIFIDLVALDDDTLFLNNHFCKLFESWQFWVQYEYGVHHSWMKIELEIGTDVAPDRDLFTFQPLCWVDDEKDKILFRKNPHGNFFTYSISGGIFQPFDTPVEQEGFCHVFRLVNSIGGPVV